MKYKCQISKLKFEYRYYYNQFQKARQQIYDIIELEQSPGTIKDPSQFSVAADWFNHFVSLYISYIDIFKKIDECYDQTVYPQMRKTIRKLLENIICRKEEIILIKSDKKSPSATHFSLCICLKFG